MLAACASESSQTPDGQVDPDAGRSVDAHLVIDATASDAGVVDADSPDAASDSLDGSVPWLVETFPDDRQAWPAPWTILGGVEAAPVAGGRGALVPTVSTASLARMGRPLGLVDAEVTIDVRFDDPVSQGMGLYVRQNGGYLRVTTPHGRGYAVFLEGFRGSRLGVWREIAGREQEILSVPLDFTLSSGVTYHVRFRCEQGAGMTTLSAKVWSGSEPEGWTVTATDSTPALQSTVGGVAVDAWSQAQPGGVAHSLSVDNLVVHSR